MKKRTIFLLSLIMIFLLAAPAAAQEEPVQYIDVQVDVLQTGGLTGDIAPLSENSVEDQLYEIICAGIEERLNGTVEGGFGKPIDISALTMVYKPVLVEGQWTLADEESLATNALIQTVYKRVVDNHPRWIFMLNGFRVSSVDGLAVGISEYYDSSYESMEEPFETAIAKALAEVSDRPTKLEKIIAAHDYLIENCAYNWIVGTWTAYDNTYNPQLYPKKDDEVYSAYGALVNGDAVCQGYALAFKLLLDEMGINTVITSSDPMNHAWNLVELDGEWYHVDVTWDDPTPDRPNGGSYSYFMLSDTTIEELGKEKGQNHHGWERIKNCESTAYESGYAFNGANPLMHYLNGEYYYIKNFTLYKSPLTGESTMLQYIGGYHYSVLWLDNKMYYVDGFYTNTIYMQLMCYDIEKDTLERITAQRDFERKPHTRVYNGVEVEILDASNDLATLRLNEDGSAIEIVSTTRREVIQKIPFDWIGESLAQNEKAKLAEPELDEEEETLEIGILLADEHDVRNLMVAFYNGDKLAGLRMVPVASTDKGLVIVDDMSVAGLPAWDTAKLFAMSGADQEHNGFALCAEVKTLDHTN